MQLGTEALEELRAIYREDLGQEISVEEADEIGNRLLCLMDLITRGPHDSRESTAPSRAVVDPSR